VIVDLARRLDMHPAEFVASLHSALANNRDTIWPASDPDTVPSRPGAAGDADVVLAALAHAVEALTVDELATALAWSLDRVTAALDYAAQHPEVAGPVAVRRTEPGTYTVTARLDRLTAAQRQNLGQLHLYRNPLPVEHVTVLLAVLALRAAPEEYLVYRQERLDAERDLKRDGLIHADAGLHRPEAQADVLYSLRYRNTLEAR
jgi:hypothetical protein